MRHYFGELVPASDTDSLTVDEMANELNISRIIINQVRKNAQRQYHCAKAVSEQEILAQQNLNSC